MAPAHGTSARRRPLMPLLLLLLIVCCLTCSSANTEFAQVPQAVFPGRAPVNRALSLQQQTQILKDIQHRFTPLQLPASTQQGPLLYSQQSTFPGGPPSPAASAAPSQQPQADQQQVFPTAQQTASGAQQTFAANTQPAPQQVFVPSNGPPIQFYSSLSQPSGTFAFAPQQTKYSADAAQNAPPPASTRVAPTDSANLRFLHGEGAGEQLLLQSARQQLYQQIRDYSGADDVAETRSAVVEPTLQPQASSFRPTPAATQASSFEPTLTSVQREEQRRQSLQTLLQEQPSRSQLPQSTSTPRPQLYTSPSPPPEQQKKAVEQLQSQFQTQLQQRQELIRKLKLAIANAEVPITADRSQVEPKPGTSGTPPPVIYLANGNKLQLVNSADEAAGLVDPSKLEIKKGPSGTPPPVIYLSNGNKLQLVNSPEEAALLQSSIRSTTPTPVTTQPPPTVSFEELTKGVLPPGAQFEVIRHKQDGGLEEVGNLPPTLPQKKVTFVFLEEQPDGTLKVQGVKGNTGTAQKDGQSSPPDVDQIIKKLQQGELKLPPSNKQPEATQFLPAPGTTPQESTLSTTFIPNQQSIQDTPKNLPANTISPSQEPVPQFTPTDGFSNQLSYQYFNIQPSRGTQSFPTISFSPSVDSQPSPSAYPEIEATNRFVSTPTPPTPVAPARTRQRYPVNPRPTDPSTESVFVSASSSQTASPIRNQFVDFDAKRQKSPRFRVGTTTTTTTTSSPVTATSRPQISYRRTTASPRAQSSLNSRKESPILYRPRFRSTTPATTSTTVYTTPSAVYTTPSTTPFTSPSTTPFTTPFQDHNIALLNQVNGQESLQKQLVKSQHVPSVPRNATKSLYESSNFPRNAAEVTSQESVYQQTTHNLTLSDVLRASGLYAMARFLRESSLDSILNDTGPYTLFAPTDKAFEALLVQLGGPDRAADKFRENPKLLSGLLLHHVVPGAFPLESLQDEMTGVSLAGTQLRVNTYVTQDEQWNDLKVTTINGARVLWRQHDVAVPQGVLHAVDRVMFPLPVGDALQTMLADREHRFESFLQAVRTSGLASVLSGSKTHTVFAPTERAFARLSAAKRSRLLSDPESARLLVSRHVVRGALYSAGLRYYQLRDALAPDSPLTLTVNAAGQLKVNSVLVVTQNIPTTNGVIHAIDSLL